MVVFSFILSTLYQTRNSLAWLNWSSLSPVPNFWYSLCKFWFWLWIVCLHGSSSCQMQPEPPCAVGTATGEYLPQAVTALCYKNSGFGVLRSHSSIPTGEMCCKERNVTLKPVSHRAAEGKQQPPITSHSVKKQAKTVILFFCLRCLMSQLWAPQVDSVVSNFFKTARTWRHLNLSPF